MTDPRIPDTGRFLEDVAEMCSMLPRSVVLGREQELFNTGVPFLVEELTPEHLGNALVSVDDGYRALVGTFAGFLILLPGGVVYAGLRFAIEERDGERGLAIHDVTDADVLTGPSCVVILPDVHSILEIGLLFDEEYDGPDPDPAFSTPPSPVSDN
jgi:hypothetical protein